MATTTLVQLSQEPRVPLCFLSADWVIEEVRNLSALEDLASLKAGIERLLDDLQEEVLHGN